MSALHDMIARCAQPGTVDWIGTRAARRAGMLSVPRVAVTLAGLEGDHARPGKRAVTLMQGEHLAAIGAYLGQGPVTPAQMRRNIVIRGLNLGSLKGREITIGTVTLRLSVICAPCSRMEETFGHGGYAAVRGHGGWCADVVRPGVIALGDAVTPVD